MNDNRAIHLRPPRIALSAVAVATVFHLMRPMELHVPLPVIGTAVGIAGFLLMMRAWWLFRNSGTAICPTERSTVLITNDVYRLTRNPMYLGIALMTAAPGIATGSLSFYLAALAFAIFVDRIFCRYEERKAVAEFGDHYRNYMKTVRRWL
jgi:protein-S-isoprenylcysteine O-methyltransferase Ste14